MRISYVQRCYYQPVTEYVRKSYYEPVTRNGDELLLRAGLTEYKYSTYYDPCTGCPQKVCTPCTSYRLREQVQLGDELRRAVRDGAGDDAQAGDRTSSRW